MTIYDNLSVCCFWNTAHLNSWLGRIRFSGCLLFSLWMGLFVVLPNTVSASPLPPQAQVTSINLEPHAAVLLDPAGHLSFDEVSNPAHAARFTPLNKPLSLGFTSAVAWVKIELTSPESSQWLLEVGQPILEDVRLYQRTAEGALPVRYGTLMESDGVREPAY